MWSNKQFFTDKLIAQKSCAGRFVNYPATSGTNTSGQVSLYWNNIQALSRKNFMDNFRIHFKITVSGTGTTSAANSIYFMKDINHAMRTLVSINGSISQEVEGWALTPILKCYSPKYKSKDNLKYNDDWVYTGKTGTGVTENTSGRGYIGNAAATFTITAETNVPLMHYLLLNGLGGVNSLNIRVILDNNLFSILHSDFTISSTTINEATITYDEYETSTEDFYIGIPYFVFYNTAITTANGTTPIESQTRNTNGACSYVFQHISQLGSLLTTRNTNDLQKPLLMNSVNVDVNNNTNCWNVSGPVEAYGRCSAVDYQGSLTDFWNNHLADNSFGCVLKVDMHKLPVNISTNDIFRFNSRVIPASSSVTNLYLSTTYCYPAVLHLSEAESEIKYISYDAFVGELADYDPLDDMIVGAGFWDKIKSFGKKVIQHAPGLISKAGEIANVVAPGSKVSQGLEKASQISNILTGTSTSLF